MDRLRILRHLRTTIGCIRTLCLLVSLLACVTFLVWKQLPSSILSRVDRFANRKVVQYISSFQEGQETLTAGNYSEAEQEFLQLKDSMKGINQHKRSYELRRDVYKALITIKLGLGKQEEALEILNEWEKYSSRDHDRDLLRTWVLQSTN